MRQRWRASAMPMYDTIIIGAGMSGIAAGIRLAHYDQRVCVLERHNTIGGLNSFYRLNGRDYDVGLHAVTNFTPRGAKKGPLARLLRQLRFRWEDFALSPQIESAVAFPGVELRFNNDVELLRSEVARAFPRQIDRFDRLLAKLIDYDDLDEDAFRLSARVVVGETIDDPLLAEMLFCPLMWYGNAREHDMAWGQYCIMFRSIFLEGLARPFAGVRLILKNLIRRFRSLGGELRLRAGVQRILIDAGRAVGVVLDNGEQLTASRVLSSAGWIETMRMCRSGNNAPSKSSGNGGDHASDGNVDTACEADDAAKSIPFSGVNPDPSAGQMSFIESISVLDCQPRKLGAGKTIVFYNDSDRFHWERPADDLCDVRTGVICSPNNFDYAASDCGELHDGVVRITSIADYARWAELDDDAYRLAKLRWYDRAVASAVRFYPDFRSHVVDTDMFTPKTIRRFTWHDNGAVYGAPDKQLDGTTPFENLFVCGTDQGFVGIVGSIISGISMANQHCLRPA